MMLGSLPCTPCAFDFDFTAKNEVDCIPQMSSFHAITPLLAAMFFLSSITPPSSWLSSLDFCIIGLLRPTYVFLKIRFYGCLRLSFSLLLPFSISWRMLDR